MTADLALDDIAGVRRRRPPHGWKVDRLLRIRGERDLAALVPPIMPVPSLDEPVGQRGVAPARRRRAYADALTRARPALAEEVRRRCGPPPWIVRSSGEEDGDGDANAGGYESLVCVDERELIETVATVALSGAGALSRRQRALAGKAAGTEVIACFVQPLLPTGLAPTVEPQDAPYVDDRDLEEIERVARRLLALFDFTAVDCEWGIETDQGLVSVTTLLARDRGAVTSMHALGFGFGAAQMTGDRPTAACLLPAGSEQRLWRGGSLRRCAVRRLWLLQARPARLEPAFRDVLRPSPAAERRLTSQYDSLPAVPLLIGRSTHGRFLAAPTLMSAWHDYLLLNPGERARVDLVLVTEGSVAEHAAIMFRQERISCFTLDTARMSQGVSTAVFDGVRCFFGEEAMIGPGDLEARRWLVLPPDCFRIAAAGDTAASTRAMLAGLPLDDNVRAAITRRSLIAHPDHWLADGASVRSPAVGERAAEAGLVPRHDPNDFPALYASAVGLRDRAIPVSACLPRLDGLRSEDATALAGCPDLRLPIALLRCERMAWADDAALAGLVAAAAALLRRDRVRDARLVLEAGAELDRETALLPIYDDGDKRALLTDFVAAVLATGTPADLLALQAVGMPAPAFVALLGAAARDGALLETALAFVGARARFGGRPSRPTHRSAQRSFNGRSRICTRHSTAPASPISARCSSARWSRISIRR
ncbi:hypothetical protein [Sphingomonas zeae]